MPSRRFAKLTATLGAVIVALALVPAAQAATTTEQPTYQIVVPGADYAGTRPNQPLITEAGNGICSDKPVIRFDYTVTTPEPGLSAVLAANKPAYDALLNADLSDPSTANLPPPLLDMSVTQAPITTAVKTFPANRRLRPQVMCILLKNRAPDPISAQITVTWTYA